MATKPEFAEYIREQLGGAGEIACKKMFGEYGVYCDGKIIGLICDDQLFVKKTRAGEAVLPGCPEAPPYEGAKPHLLVESVDDRELMTRLITATCEELPAPKPKKKKTL